MNTSTLSVVLAGQGIRLEPLAQRHAEGIAAVADPSIFRFFGGTILTSTSEAAAADYVDRRLALAQTSSFAMVLQKGDAVVGHSSYMNIRQQDLALEIGSTWISPAWQGGFVNPEAKYLMLRHAFEQAGFRRVELKTDERNLQSRAAIAKLGGVQEGILRKHMVAADGHVRNTVMFSILDTEWPEVKRRLEGRLAAYF